MTAQIEDRIKYKNKEYSIVATSEPFEFNPKDYGIVPRAVTTACWRGFFCAYEISDDGVYLKDLYINTLNHEYPEIEGTSVNEYSKSGNEEFHRYQNIYLKIPYTGKILLGDEFLFGYHIHMGFQRAWAYKVLKEYIFQDGKLVTIIDHSKKAAEIRDKIEADPDFISKLKSDIFKFVNDSFSLDYSVKARWLMED